MLRPFGEGLATERALGLLAEFGTLGAVLAAPLSRLRRVAGSPAVARHVRSAGEAMRVSLREAAICGPLIKGTDALARYLTLEMAYLTREQVRVLYLTASNELRADEVLFEGSIDSALIEARPIVHRALDLAATGLILVHNHPSGRAEPSQRDIAATRHLAHVCQCLEITLHDHIIVARSGWSSLRQQGYL